MAEALGSLPPAQATALGQALGLGPEGTPARFAVPAAVMGLLGAAAEDGPVLCLLDDVQWIDAPSVEAIVFAARRLRDDGVAMLLAAREGAGRAVDASGVETLDIGPLDADAAGALLRAMHGERLAGSVAAGLVAAADGRPLALVELANALSPAQLAGREALPPVLPEGLSVDQAFRGELAGLPDDTRRALTVAAAADAGEDAAVLGRALALAGVPAWVLEPAETANVIRLDGGSVDFRHPLLRAAAYHAAAPEERRAAHRALADAHPEGAAQRAWHLAAAADGADAEAAADLDAAAEQARARGGFASAARAATRAADLSDDDTERTQRLLAAARDFVAGGDPEQAAARAEDAYARAEDPATRADLEWLLGHVWMRLGRSVEAERLLLASADRVEPAEPVRAAILLLEASLARLATGGADIAIAHARRAHDAATGNPPLEALAEVMIGQALVAEGAMAEGAALVEGTQTFLFELDPVHAPSDLIAVGANALVWTDRYAPARAILARVIAAGREHGALARLAYPLGAQCVLDFRSGRWADAIAVGEEAVRASVDTGADAVTALIGAWLAEVEAHRGLTEQAVARAREADALAVRTGSDGFRMFGHHAAGVALLAGGDAEAAVVELEAAWEWSRRIGTLGAAWLPTQPALIDAYLALGRKDDAAAETERLAQSNPGEQTRARRRPRSSARAASSPATPTHLERALEHHARVDNPFERARTQLALGGGPARRPGRVARPPPRRARRLRAPRRGPVGGAGAGGAARRRRDLAATRAGRRRRPHALRAPGRAGRRPRRHEPRGRRAALPQPEDRRAPPRRDLPQARGGVAGRPREADRGRRGAGGGCRVG